MEVLAMRLHARERRMLRQIEECLRRDDPALDTLLAGQSSRRRQSAPRAWVVWVMTAYLVPPALLTVGLVLGAIWLVVAGSILCPFVPVLGSVLIRRRSVRRGRSHASRP
jgi:hypothetical protein